ncbi:MAG: hypothetical protein JWQ22_127 [Devosia sp.]|nr:hypothetical protein [Devosia sp.]
MSTSQPVSGPVAQMKAIWANHVSDTVVTAQVWAAERGKHDPQWNHKQHLVADAVAADIARNGFPTTQVATIALVDRAIYRVNFLLRSIGL